MEEALSVREDVVGGLEVSDELLEFLEEGVVRIGAGLPSGAGAVISGERLVAVVDGSFVPPRHLRSNSEAR